MSADTTNTTGSTISLPGHSAPAAGLEAPFEMLATCHERVERMLALLARLRQHLLDTGCDEPARQAARDVMRYFDIAAPLHHQDEELHVFPPLLAGPHTGLHLLVRHLIQEHRQMESVWGLARIVLQSVAEHDLASCWTPFTPDQNQTLDDFAILFRQHLDDENTIAYPAAQAALQPEDVQTMSEDMMERRGVVPRQ